MTIKWRLVKTKTGWVGLIELPTDWRVPPGIASVGLKGVGKTKSQALGRAAAGAEKIEQLMADHPELAAILPPGAPLALKAIKGIAKSAAAGRLAEALSHHTGPAIKRLGKALHL
jgi:hypothetical protein